MIFPSRTRRGRDPNLRLKTALLVAGAVLVLFAGRYDVPVLAWAGIALLALGIALRLLPRSETPPKS